MAVILVPPFPLKCFTRPRQKYHKHTNNVCPGASCYIDPRWRPSAGGGRTSLRGSVTAIIIDNYRQLGSVQVIGMQTAHIKLKHHPQPTALDNGQTPSVWVASLYWSSSHSDDGLSNLASSRWKNLPVNDFIYGLQNSFTDAKRTKFRTEHRRPNHHFELILELFLLFLQL